jgi:hypothetical protein
MMLAVMDTLKWPDHISAPKYKCGNAGKLTGTNFATVKAHEFEIRQSLYADDCAVLFEKRENMIEGTQILYNHLKRFGLTMHVGRGGGKSKTEAMYVPALSSDYGQANTNKYNVDVDGHVDFTTSFQYVGGIIHYDLKADVEINNRIMQASKAFYSMKRLFHDPHLPLATKGMLLKVLVVPILLYGCETWNARADSLKKLQAFQRKCVRTITKMTPMKMKEAHVKSNDLNEKVGVKPVLENYYNRLLTWVGKVCRMPIHRLPRQLIASWVEHPRPKKGREQAWGHTVKHALRRVQLPLDMKALLQLANEDVERWNELISKQEHHSPNSNEPGCSASPN